VIHEKPFKKQFKENLSLINLFILPAADGLLSAAYCAKCPELVEGLTAYWLLFQQGALSSLSLPAPVL
jgi:hypothetical protein